MLAGEANAAHLFEESCHLMGEVFANAVNAFDLEAIILGGGVSNLPVWYERVPAYLKNLCLVPARADPDLEGIPWRFGGCRRRGLSGTA